MHAKLGFNFMLCLSTKPCCVWVQINVLWVQIQVLSALEFMLCFNSSSSCVWVQSHVFVLILCCIWVQYWSHIWIQILFVFELNFMLCLSIIVYCIIQWMSVIVHLVRMAERAQYLDVVTRVPVGMDSLGISVKVHLIFI